MTTVSIHDLRRLNACKGWLTKWESLYGDSPVPLDTPRDWAALAKAGFAPVLSWGYRMTGEERFRPCLAGVDLSGADLRRGGLPGVDLSGANLRGANLRGADLRGAILDSANLRGADLRGADLRAADLSGADLCRADLTDAGE